MECRKDSTYVKEKTALNKKDINSHTVKTNNKKLQLQRSV